MRSLNGNVAVDDAEISVLPHQFARAHARSVIDSEWVSSAECPDPGDRTVVSWFECPTPSRYATSRCHRTNQCRGRKRDHCGTVLSAKYWTGFEYGQ